MAIAKAKFKDYRVQIENIEAQTSDQAALIEIKHRKWKIFKKMS